MVLMNGFARRWIRRSSRSYDRNYVCREMVRSKKWQSEFSLTTLRRSIVLQDPESTYLSVSVHFSKSSTPARSG
jgi:hypothetical protein